MKTEINWNQLKAKVRNDIMIEITKKSMFIKEKSNMAVLRWISENYDMDTPISMVIADLYKCAKLEEVRRKKNAK